LGLVLCAAPVQAQEGGAVTIYRGAQAETVRFTDQGGVTVVRGQPAAQPDATPEDLAARHKLGRTVAGDTLWIVDPKTDRLLACELRRTTQVGERRIRCTERALPVAFR
jgi:hypothetical protein